MVSYIQKIKQIALFFALVVWERSEAQINTSGLYDPHFSTYSSRYLPGRLGTNDGVCELSIAPFLNVYAYTSSNSVGFGSLQKFLFSETVSESQVSALLKQMKKSNRLFVGAEVQLFSVAINIKNKDKKDLFALKIDTRDRVHGSLQYSQNVLELALEGNKQFAGQTIDLSDTRLNASWLREYGLGVSVPISVDIVGKKLTIRPAATLKFIQGIGNISMPRGKATMYTDPDGRYLDFTTDYRVNMSIPSNAGGIGSGSGMGWGLDLGVNFNWHDFIITDLGLVDIGSVSFNKNTKNYTGNTKYRFDGVEIPLFQDGNTGNFFDAQYLQDIFKPEETANKYKTSLGAKLILQMEMRFQKRERTTKKDKKNVYHRHRTFVTYVQGLENAYNATTSPYFSLGYTYSFRNILNMGLNLGFGGYNKVNIGPFVSVKGGPFVFGVGSNNLTGFMGKKGSGADAYFNMGWSF